MNIVDLALIFLYLAIGVVYAIYAYNKRKKSFLRYFLITIFLTPFTTTWLLFRKKKEKITYIVSRYKCPRCEYKFDHPEPHCPICFKEGYQVELSEVSQIMT